MNAKLSKIVLTLGTVLVRGTSASMTVGAASIQRGDAQFNPIHAGMTQDEVRSQLGTATRTDSLHPKF